MDADVLTLIYRYRKERRTRSLKKISPNIRTSVCALSKRGSITAEAAMVVSFFFLAVICLTYLFQILSLQVTVRNGMHAVGRKMAVELCENPVMKPDNI